jgi:hypothetical protein
MHKMQILKNFWVGGQETLPVQFKVYKLNGGGTAHTKP